MDNSGHFCKTTPLFQLKWEPRIGPLLLINFKNRKLGLAFICHRKPERSFSVFGYPFPLCSRCTGILTGVLAFLLLKIFQPQFPLYTQILLMTPMLVDGFSQLFRFRQSNNVLRFITGFLFSIGFWLILVK